MTLYSRPGCGLCDEARAVVLSVGARADFDLEEIDISDDDALELEYGIRIPVVAVDGEELFEISVDPRALEAAVRR